MSRMTNQLVPAGTAPPLLQSPLLVVRDVTVRARRGPRRGGPPLPSSPQCRPQIRARRRGLFARPTGLGRQAGRDKGRYAHLDRRPTATRIGAQLLIRNFVFFSIFGRHKEWWESVASSTVACLTPVGKPTAGSVAGGGQCRICLSYPVDSYGHRNSLRWLFDWSKGKAQEIKRRSCQFGRRVRFLPREDFFLRSELMLLFL